MKYIFALLLACLFSPGAVLLAQQAPDVFPGGLDVLYAQSQLHSIDQAWFAPLASSTSAPDLDGPRNTTPRPSRKVERQAAYS